MNKLKFKRGDVDCNLYTQEEDGEKLIVMVYVDDIIFGSKNTKLCEAFAENMQEEFEMSMLGKLHFFLGLQVLQLSDGIFINQTKYAKELLKKFGFDSCKPVGTPAATSEKLNRDVEGENVDQKEFRSMVGSLLYLTASRPDIMQAVCMVARFQGDPRLSHSRAVKRILRYISDTVEFGLWYGEKGGLELIAYCDADWAGNVEDRKSTSGGAFLVGERLVCWFSKKQSSVALSKAEAEYISAAAVSTQIVWMKRQLLDLGVETVNPIRILCDSQSAIQISRNPVQHTRTKHIDIRYHYLKDQVLEKLITMEFVSTQDQLADILTKPLLKDQFHKLRSLLGVIPPPRLC